MRWSRLILGLLLLPLISATGLGVWAYANRGYPNAVYYYRIIDSAMGRNTGVTMEVWLDPVRHWKHMVNTPTVGTPDDTLYRDGYQYDLSTPGNGRIPYSESAGDRLFYDLLHSGGLPRLNATWYTGASGRRSRVILHGHAAVRVDGVDSNGRPFSEWFDAKTHVPLEQRDIVPDGVTIGGTTVETLQYTRWTRYAPNSLPATFFDPPSANGNLWDRLCRWLQDRVADG